MESIKKTPQYYKPSFNEFCVGFKYELQRSKNNWTKEIVDQVYENEYLSPDEDNYPLNGIRVKCLDEEDILSLGFSPIGDTSDFDPLIKEDKRYSIYGFKKDNIQLGYYRDEFSKTMEYGILDINRNAYCFIGKIRNKLELIKILNMVSIDIKYDINLDVSD